jgi:hypothetical protein
MLDVRFSKKPLTVGFPFGGTDESEMEFARFARS